MPHVATVDALAHTISDLFKAQRLTLFAGAGVGAIAGLPDWQQYMESLASVAQSYEPETAALMRARMRADLYAEAAHYYKTCALIPHSDKFQRLVEPFKKYDPTKLACIANLPFEAIITTNYENSLHDAWISRHHRLPFCAELGDGTLRAALFRKDCYIARIHGRVDVPESIVIDTDDYSRILGDDAYIDLLKEIFTQKCCLFVGFSFLDPAIRGVLETVKAKMGVYPSTHHAFIPSSAVGLAERMAPFNIKITYYDGDHDHQILWDAFEIVCRELTEVPASGGISRSHR